MNNSSGYGVNHELRTILNQITGYLNILIEDAAEFHHEELLPELNNILSGKSLSSDDSKIPPPQSKKADR